MTRDEILRLCAQDPQEIVACLLKLQEANAALYALVTTQKTQIDQLTKRLQELENRLNKDSHNSSKPPSGDGFKKKPTSLRKKTGKPTGGQQGHPGKTLAPVATPDEIVVHTPTTCTHCGQGLEQVEATATDRRQVFDLPPLALFVTEHQAQSKCCPGCQHQNRAAFPPQVSQPVQYGAQIKALATYLMEYQLLPFARTQELLADLLGTSLCEATLLTTLAECAKRLEPVTQQIKEAITQAEVVHFDETGLRIAKQLHWLHTAGTKTLTSYAHHPKRGREAIEAIGILPHFQGTAIHDAFASYLGYACRHGLCDAHLLRELIGLWETTKQPWTQRLLRLLVLLHREVEAAKSAGQKALCPKRLARYVACYERLVAKGLAQNPAAQASGKRGRCKQSEARNLLLRLEKYQAWVLVFAFDFSVPFDNNLAERDLRMVKVRQKVSGCFRSEEGASIFCRIRGYISTLRKQGHPVLSALQSVFTGNPYVPNLDG